ncbi:MAG: VPLPA-CTERM sorting domain-containing protein [Octadecabacter sp.]|nr:VPLPA-CTERM sorting domain-containing protein [Octadecabacter sp.]
MTALTDRSQVTETIVATEDFNGFDLGTLPLSALSASGIEFNTGGLGTILPGVTQSGTATQPLVTTGANFFPTPSGGGSSSGNYLYFGGVMTFTETITQFGLTFSRNGNQFITAWDTIGNILGQVAWVPGGASSFVGIDTGGVAIGMLAVGNDDVYGGASYNITGSTIIADDYVWAGELSQVPLPAGAVLLLTGMIGLTAMRKRRKIHSTS